MTFLFLLFCVKFPEDFIFQQKKENNGDYIEVKGVDFGKGAKSFEASIVSASQGEKIEIRIDSISGALLGTCIIKSTGDLKKGVTKRCIISKSKGIHDLYIMFIGGNGKMFNFD